MTAIWVTSGSDLVTAMGVMTCVTPVSYIHVITLIQNKCMMYKL